MAWQDIPASTYNRLYSVADTSMAANKNIKITLQYSDNPDYLSPTKARIRFKFSSVNGADNWDKYYVLIGGKTGTLYPIKTTYTKNNPDSDAWPFYSDGFNITKKYSDSTFTIPEYYIINNGNDAVGVFPSVKTAAKDSTTAATAVSKAYKAATDTRANWSCKKDSQNIVIAKSSTQVTNVSFQKYSSAVSDPLVIIDNGDNSFTIRAKPGKAGTNNSVKNTTLYYKYNKYNSSTGKVSSTSLDDWDWVDMDTKSGSYGYDKTTGELVVTKKIHIDYGNNTALEYHKSKASQVVYACVEVEGTYNTIESDEIGASITQYVGPNNPGEPSIAYKKNRFTLKEPWEISWKAATQSNSKSPVQGYLIRIFKKAKDSSTFISMPFYDVSGNILTEDTGAADKNQKWGYYTENTSVSLTLNPANQKNLAVGDTIQIRIIAYSKDKKNNKKFLDGLTPRYSSDYLIQNSGIVRVKVGDSWKEGQVYVKVNGSWKEAESVKTKVNGSWKESQ